MSAGVVCHIHIFFFSCSGWGVGTSVAFPQRKILTDGAKIFSEGYWPQTNDNPDQTKVRPEKDFPTHPNIHVHVSDLQ